MSTGFVFGKFYPFHAGHEVLIAHALTLCSKLYVLVCVSDRESIPEQTRVDWLCKRYRDNPVLTVQGMTYSESELPNTSVANQEVSRVWSARFLQILPRVELVVTGEEYGDYVAEYMGIKHIRIIRENGISASAIRNDILKNWEQIVSTCRPDLIRRIFILGTESTGKSTLTQALAQHFNTNYVQEAGRDLVTQTEQCTFDDLATIAREHAHRIDVACNAARRLLFVDTDLYTTKSYATYLFGRHLDVPQSVITSNRADLRLYLDASAPYVQDGTRLDIQRRNELDRSHRTTLDVAHERYTVLTGSYEERFTKAVKLISELLPL